MQALILAVTSLTAAERDLVLAFYFDGRSQADIAADYGVSVKSVETRLDRVRALVFGRSCGTLIRTNNNDPIS